MYDIIFKEKIAYNHSFGVLMKCKRCGKYTTKLKEGYLYCKGCNLIYWFIIPNAEPRVFAMGDNSKQVAY